MEKNNTKAGSRSKWNLIITRILTLAKCRRPWIEATNFQYMYIVHCTTNNHTRVCKKVSLMYKFNFVTRQDLDPYETFWSRPESFVLSVKNFRCYVLLQNDQCARNVFVLYIHLFANPAIFAPSTAFNITHFLLIQKFQFFLSLDLHEGRPSYRRRIQPSKQENIQLLKTWNFFTFLIFMGLFALLDSDTSNQNQCGSASRSTTPLLRGKYVNKVFSFI
jgi:hypothetical protein